MTLGAHVPAPPSPEKHQEEVSEGDSVTIMYKGEMVEAAVVKKRGLQVHLLFEDNETKKWADATELRKVVKGGAEELMSRAARAALAREEAEAEKRRKAEEAARLKAEADAKEAARKAEEKRIRDAYMGRARKAFDWLPTGVYFNTDHLPIPDHQKDIFRIVWYEADPNINYKREKAPKFAPDNEACGGRVFYTDGTVFATNWVGTGSADGVLKGDGCEKQLAEELEVPFEIKEIEIKSEFDGGRTLKKYDAYPKEDPAEWIEMETDMFKGWVRKDESELAEADPHWWVW